MSLKERWAQEIQDNFSKQKVIVIGDLMVDEYVVGKVKRISPEAPVPVLDFSTISRKAGGAANVATNMKTLGAQVTMVAVAQEDEIGIWIRDYLSDYGICIEGIVAEKGRPTTLKTRYATANQQLLRVDSEDASCISKETEAVIYGYLEDIICEYNAVVLSDYKKGVLNNPDFVRAIIKLCNDNGVFVSIDSKSRNIEAFKNADFVKPNNLELEDAVGIKITDNETFEIAGRAYLEKSQARMIIVTRGAEGVSIFVNNHERYDFASEALQVFDVTGAGDTVISTTTLAMICGLSICESVQIANLAASVVISKVGTAVVNQEELIKRLYA